MTRTVVLDPLEDSVLADDPFTEFHDPWLLLDCTESTGIQSVAGQHIVG